MRSIVAGFAIEAAAGLAAAACRTAAAGLGVFAVLVDAATVAGAGLGDGLAALAFTAGAAILNRLPHEQEAVLPTASAESLNCLPQPGHAIVDIRHPHYERRASRRAFTPETWQS